MTMKQSGYMAIDEVEILPHKAKTIESKKETGRPLRCEKLMVYESSRGVSSIERMMFGKRAERVAANSDPVKTVFFSEVALGNGFSGSGDEIVLGSDEKFGLRVRNDTDKPIKVAAVVFGTYVE